MPKDPSTEAQQIFADLTVSAAFPIVAVDTSGVEFNPPVETGFLYTDPSALVIEDLTDTTVGGSGVFDQIMVSIRNHIKEEYDEGRIQGREYSETYVALTTAALSNAVQFLTVKDKVSYQNALVQMQAREAHLNAIMAKLRLEQGKQDTVIKHAQALTAQAEFALMKMRLASEDINYTRVEKDLELLTAQISMIGKEEAIVDYRLLNILPEEKRQLTYTTDHVLRSQVNKTDYETATLMPRQVAAIDEDILIKSYQRLSVLPAQKNLVEEQLEVQRAQTLDTRTDGATVEGAIGKQKDLNDEQITSYEKDARYKAAKLWVDGWITQKSLDEGLLAPNQLTNAEIDEVMQSIKTNLGLGTA